MDEAFINKNTMLNLGVDFRHEFATVDKTYACQLSKPTYGFVRVLKKEV